MTEVLNLTGGVLTPEFVAALNANFAAIDELLDGRRPWRTKTAHFNAEANGQYNCDTSAGGFTATLPASPSEGDRFSFSDYVGTWATDPLLIDPNGNEWEDAGDGSDPEEPMTCDAPAQFEVVFAGGKLRVR